MSGYSPLPAALRCAFAGQVAATVIGAVAFAALLSCTAQISVQRTAAQPVIPDVTVDRFMTDGEHALFSEAPEISSGLQRSIRFSRTTATSGSC